MITSHILALFYNRQFGLGLLVGLVGMYFYQRWRCKHLDKKEPMVKHPPPGINRMVAAALITVAMLGYILLKAQQTQDITVATNERLKTCTIQFQQSLKYRSDITSQDTELSNQISDIRSQLDDALGTFLDRRLNPPPDIAKLDANDPRRVQWKDDITYVYAQWQRKLRDRIDQLVKERKVLLDARVAHPIPDIDC